MIKLHTTSCDGATFGTTFLSCDSWFGCKAFGAVLAEGDSLVIKHALLENPPFKYLVWWFLPLKCTSLENLPASSPYYEYTMISDAARYHAVGSTYIYNIYIYI